MPPKQQNTATGAETRRSSRIAEKKANAATNATTAPQDGSATASSKPKPRTKSKAKPRAPPKSKKDDTGRIKRTASSKANGVEKPKPTLIRINPKAAAAARIRKIQELERQIAAARAETARLEVEHSALSGIFEQSTEIPPSKGIAASSSSRTAFQYGQDKPARVQRELIGTLEVYTSPERSQPVASRIWYSARFGLMPVNGAATEDVDCVGEILACRIDKKTSRAPLAAGTWIRDYLQPELEDMEVGVDSELALCLRALFTNDGIARPGLNALEDELNDRGVIFIKLIYTKAAYQRSGLLKPMLQAYRHMLQQLPEWFVFNDVLVLVPGPPEGDEGKSWGRTKDAAVRKILQSAYERDGGYQLLVRGVVGEYEIPVMGRMVRDDD